MIGATQIIDAKGNIITERKFNEGAGIIYADIAIGKSERNDVIIPPDKYWIEDLPEPYLYAWNCHL